MDLNTFEPTFLIQIEGQALAGAHLEGCIRCLAQPRPKPSAG